MHAAGSSDGPSTPLPGARATLALLLAINLFNYIDRQVLAAVEPEIRQELLAGDPDAETKMGLLSTAFLVAFMVFSPVFGWLADHVSRWLLVGIGVILWSLASGASGWDWGVPVASAYTILLVTRCFVGIGEGAYGPVAPTMLADLYPVSARGRIMAWFYLAIPVGGALGYALGEGIKNVLDWRWAFFLVVPPGVALGVLCWLMPEPPRGQTDGKAARKATWADYLKLLSIRSYVFNTLGMTGMCFAMGGLAFWMPQFLTNHQAEGLFERPALQAPTAQAGAVPAVPQAGAAPAAPQRSWLIGPRTLFGILTALAGLIATLSGGIIGDWLRTRYSGAYFLVSGITMLIGFPMVLLVIWTPFPWAWIFVFLAVFCLFFNTGPTNTILANVTHPSIRATGFALNIFFIHLLGDAISPPVIGYVTTIASLDVGFIVVSAAMLVCGVFWIWGARYLEHDTAMAPSLLDR